MSDLDYTCYYMGHGAMHYIKVINSMGYVEKKILIDAGSNRDHFKCTKENSDTVLQDILDSTANQCIFCLTHPHDDHYSYFIDIINRMGSQDKINVLDMFYIGGCSSTEYQSAVTNKDSPHASIITGIQSLFIALLKNQIPTEKIFLFQKVESRPLWQGTEGVVLYYLFGNLFDIRGETANDNSANYAVINEFTDTALWVTGDATGSTFHNLCRQAETLSMIHYLLQKKKVYMTVPHHGSYDTLNEHSFGICEFRDGDYQAPARLQSLLDFLDVVNYALILSADYLDSFKHPDGLALGIYSYLCAEAEYNDGWPVYRNRSIITTLGGKELYGEEISNGEWFWQNLPNEIYSTVIRSECNPNLGEFTNINLQL